MTKSYPIRTAGGKEIYIKAFGSGTKEDPFIADNNLSSSRIDMLQLIDTVGNGSGDVNQAIDGSTTSVLYKITPPAGVKYSIAKIIFALKDTGTFDSGGWGNQTNPLTNGCDIILSKYGIISHLVDGNIKSHYRLASVCHDMDHASWGSGDEFLTAKFSFPESTGKFLELEGDNGNYLGAIIQDDLTHLVDQRVSAQGFQEVTADESDYVLFSFDSSLGTEASITLQGVSGIITRVFWGDGEYDDVVHTGSDVAVTHTYTSGSGTYTIYTYNTSFYKIVSGGSEAAISCDISTLSNLTNYADLNNTNATGNIEALSNLTSQAIFNNTGVYGDIENLSKLDSLAIFSDTKVSISSVFSFGISYAGFNNCSFSETEVQYLLESLVEGGQSDGTCVIAGDNASANTAALAAIATLEADGWTITYNS